MDKLVSVVVPVYKVERFLVRCIDSILRQTYSNLDIILVDDGSPDRCGIICDEYGKLDRRIRVFHKANGGLAQARNVGISQAEGEYIAFVDSDDFIHERYIERLYQMCEDYNVPISQCGFARVAGEQEDSPKSVESEYEVMLYESRDILKMLYKPGNINVDVAWNKLYRRDLFQYALFPEGRVYEDFATTYKLFYAAGRIAVTNEPLYYYYMSENSITRRGFYPKKLDYILTYEERLEFFRNHEEGEIYRNTLYSYYFALIRFYYICRKNCKEMKDRQKEFREKIRRTYRELKAVKDFSRLSKLKITIAHYLPAVYYCYGMNVRR